MGLNRYASLHVKLQGVTLVELMVTIAIMAILLMVAVPGFQQIMLNSRLRSYANDFAASATLARSEALKRNHVVKLCASANGTSCAAVEWESGWIVIDDVLDPDVVIAAHPSLAAGYALTETGGDKSIEFKASGAGSDSAVLTLCRASPVGNEERVITLAPTGRSTIAKTTAGICS